MKVAAAGWLFIALSCHAAEWQETLSPPVPGDFPPPQAVNVNYRFGWSKLLAARATADFHYENANRLELKVHAATLGAARVLWRLDARHRAIADVQSLRPVRVEQTEVYRNEVIQTHLKFDRSGVVKMRQKLPQDEKPKRKKIKIANLYDLQTALLFVRSQRLNRGDVYRFIVYPGTTSYLATVQVIGREKLKLRGGRHDAIKLELRLHKIEKDFTLAPHSKFTRGYAWLSADEERLPLRAEVQVFIGRVWMEIDTARYPATKTTAGTTKF